MCGFFGLFLGACWLWEQLLDAREFVRLNICYKYRKPLILLVADSQLFFSYFYFFNTWAWFSVLRCTCQWSLIWSWDIKLSLTRHFIPTLLPTYTPTPSQVRCLCYYRRHAKQTFCPRTVRDRLIRCGYTETPWLCSAQCSWSLHVNQQATTWRVQPQIISVKSKSGSSPTIGLVGQLSEGVE